MSIHKQVGQTGARACKRRHHTVGTFYGARAFVQTLVRAAAPVRLFLNISPVRTPAGRFAGASKVQPPCLQRVPCAIAPCVLSTL